MSYININGKLIPAESAAVRADNRALRYGYGLFETMLVRNGQIRLEHYHWKRLREGIAALDIPADKFFMQKLKAALLNTVQKVAPQGFCRVRVQVYAGNGGLYDADFKAGFIVEAFPLDEGVTELNESGLRLGIADAVKHSSAISHIKTSAALPYALAARQAKVSRWNDALMLNEHGRAIESTIANLFWVEDDVIYSPPISEGCIAGVMRRYLMEMATDAGFRIAERLCTITDLERAQTVFLSNAIRGVRWVASISDRDYKSGICQALHKQLIHVL